MKRAGEDAVKPKEGQCVRLRGLPYGCTKEDIIQFFNGKTVLGSLAHGQILKLSCFTVPRTPSMIYKRLVLCLYRT